MLPLAAFVGLGMHAYWQKMSASVLARRLRVPAGVAVLLGLALPWLLFGGAGMMTIIGVMVGCWLILSSLLDPVTRALRKRPVPGSTPAPQPRPLARAQWGMILAHLASGCSFWA